MRRHSSNSSPNTNKSQSRSLSHDYVVDRRVTSLLSSEAGATSMARVGTSSRSTGRDALLVLFLIGLPLLWTFRHFHQNAALYPLADPAPGDTMRELTTSVRQCLQKIGVELNHSWHWESTYAVTDLPFVTDQCSDASVHVMHVRLNIGSHAQPNCTGTLADDPKRAGAFLTEDCRRRRVHVAWTGKQSGADAVDGAAAAAAAADKPSAPNAYLLRRGHGTLKDPQSSYVISLDAPLEWRGQRSILLNKHFKDVSRVRNKLSFDLMCAVPFVPSVRALFVELLVDGESYGLFTSPEPADEAYVRRRHRRVDGQLYWAQHFWFQRHDALRLTTDPAYRADLFEHHLDSQLGDDHAPLLRMLGDVSAPPTYTQEYQHEFERNFERHFDRRNVLTWLAMTALAGNHDTLFQNYDLYRSPERDSKFVIGPWDYDGTFGRDAAARRRWFAFPAVWWGTDFLRSLLRTDSLWTELRDRVRAIHRCAMSRERVEAQLGAYWPNVQRFFKKGGVDYRHNSAIAANAYKHGVFGGEWQRIVNFTDTLYDSFEETSHWPMPVSLVYSKSKSENETPCRLFSWTSSYHLTGEKIHYELQIAERERFAEKDVVARMDRGTSTTALMYIDEYEEIEVNRPYYWRVRAYCASNATYWYAYVNPPRDESQRFYYHGSRDHPYEIVVWG